MGWSKKTKLICYNPTVIKEFFLSAKNKAGDKIEKVYFGQMELVGDNQLFNEKTNETFNKVNKLWFLAPSDTSGEHTQLSPEFGQKLDDIQLQKTVKR